MDDEVFVTFVPELCLALFLGSLVFCGLALLLWYTEQYPPGSAIKISFCFYIMVEMAVGMMLREKAYRSATEHTAKRRLKLNQAIERLDYRIRRREMDLEFIDLELPKKSTAKSTTKPKTRFKTGWDID